MVLYKSAEASSILPSANHLAARLENFCRFHSLILHFSEVGVICVVLALEFDVHFANLKGTLAAALSLHSFRT